MLELTTQSKPKIPDLFQKKYFHSLDGLRGLSILLVIVAHFGMSYKINFDFHPWANLGVQFFFVISGFLITTLLLKEKINSGNISLKKFYIRRFFRIIPVAFLYLFCVVIFRFAFGLNLNPIYILTSFLFIRNFFMESKGIDHLTTHYWSLSVEEQFYFIFPVILKKSIKLYSIFLISMLLLPILIYYFLGDFSNNHIIIYYISNFTTNFIGISLGSLFSILAFNYTFIINYNFRLKEVVITLLFAIIIVVTYFTYIGIIATYAKCISFGIIILLLISNDNQSSFYYRLFNSRGMKYIGVLSFSLYIWQQPLTQNMHYINNYLTNHGIYTGIYSNIIVSALCTLLLFLISYLSYNYFEIIFLKIKNKFK